jgi:outer membrane protein assembly factor BamB
MRPRSLILLLGLGLVAHAQPLGWRHDGTGVYPTAFPPVALAKGHQLAWEATTSGWGNATPVRAGGLLLVTVEPTRLLALDVNTGRTRWQADHPVTEALTGEERARIAARVAEADAAEVELQTARTAYSELQRQARRSTGDPEISARLAAASAALDKLKRSIDEAAAYRTPPDKEIIGYASPTPVTDGARIWAVFGNGVVACHNLDGTLVWTRWMGPPSTTMRGYAFGQTASPQLVGSTLVVGFGKLTGLDAATGAVRWTAGPYDDYGTPAVARVDGIDLVLTPRGVVHRASDGVVLAKDLGDLVYIGPTVIGRDVYYVGTNSTQHRDMNGAVSATAWRLAKDASGGIVATRRWQTVLQTGQALYAPPVVHKGLIYAVTKRAELHVIDDRDGSVVYTQALGDRLMGDVFPSPSVAGDLLYLFSASGTALTLALGRSFQQHALTSLDPMRSTPLFEGERIYLRTLDKVYAFDGAIPIGPGIDQPR